MNYFDDSTINFLNGFSRASEAFDYFMALLISNNFVKGGILMTVLWWFWFRDKKETSEIKEIKGGGEIKKINRKNRFKEIHRINKIISFVGSVLY